MSDGWTSRLLAVYDSNYGKYRAEVEKEKGDPSAYRHICREMAKRYGRPPGRSVPDEGLR